MKRYFRFCREYGKEFAVLLKNIEYRYYYFFPTLICFSTLLTTTIALWVRGLLANVRNGLYIEDELGKIVIFIIYCIFSCCNELLMYSFCHVVMVFFLNHFTA